MIQPQATRQFWKNGSQGKAGRVLTMIAFCLLLPFIVGAVRTPVTDTGISDAVEDELKNDMAVPAHRIDVTVENGVVTLEGFVNNILAKERVSRIAGTVKGVRSVVNTIEVSPSRFRRDYEIRADVKDALLLDPAADSFEIDVAVKRGIVSLSGDVESQQEKTLCATVAKGVNGVVGVNNRISVDYPIERKDSEMQAEIEKGLEWNAYLDAGLIDVAVQDAEVSLSGVVGSYAEKRMARKDAWVHGVEAVQIDGLKVERWKRDPELVRHRFIRKDDADVEAALRDAFLYDPRVAAFEIDPQVSDGVVTLRGTVDNVRARRAAAADARCTTGVRLVKNRIDVKPPEQLSDAAVEKKIRSAFVRDPYVERYEIAIDVDQGVTRLDGFVNNYYEKTRAENLASEISGVIAVENALKVDKQYDPLVYNPYVDMTSPYDYSWYRYASFYPTRSDAEIKAEIEDELYWSPFVDDALVDVIVDDGVVTLDGTVASDAQYEAAESNAYEGGAVYVDNDLVVVHKTKAH